MEETRRAAKSRHGAALFDLYAHDASGGAETSETLRESSESREDTQVPSVDAPGLPEESEPAVSADTPERVVDLPTEREPFFEIEGDRIRVSLTSVTAAIAVFAALIVLGGVYGLGRDHGVTSGIKRGYQEGREVYAADALSEIEAARRQPPATHVISSLLSDVDQPSTPGKDATAKGGVASPKWVRGHTYIVVQEFSPGRADDALKAQAFLARQEIETEMVQYPSGSIQLMSAQGYNRSDPTQRQLADQLLERVHRAGSAYSAAGGGYKLAGYFKTLKNDSW